MKNFEEYVKDWFNQYVEEHTSDLYGICKAVCGTKVKKNLGQDEYAEMLADVDAHKIYGAFFGYSVNEAVLDDIPSTFSFWEDLLDEYMNECEKTEYRDFMKMIAEDIASFMDQYDDPIDFFDDLGNGGCSSGMISMFIYDSDCRSFYTKHANEMEEFREDVEEEIGFPMKFDRGINHFVNMCWMCYEIFGYRIASTLFPDDI